MYIVYKASAQEVIFPTSVNSHKCEFDLVSIVNLKEMGRNEPTTLFISETNVFLDPLSVFSAVQSITWVIGLDCAVRSFALLLS